MSSRSWDVLENGDRQYRWWCGDNGWEMQVTRLASTGGYQFAIQWYEDVGNHQEEKRSINAYAHGKYLEGLQAFLTEDIKDGFMQENYRLHDLLQQIKHRAKYPEDREVSLTDWIMDNVSDKDAGWQL